jgi:hypothetical protein
MSRLIAVAALLACAGCRSPVEPEVCPVVWSTVQADVGGVTVPWQIGIAYCGR